MERPGDLPAPVVRPSLPPALWLAAGVWCGAACAETWAWHQAKTLPGALLPGLCFVALLAWRIRASSNLPRMSAGWIATLGVCAGLALGAIAWAQLAHDARILSSVTSFDLEVSGDPRQGPFGARVDAVVCGGPADSARVGIALPENSTDVRMGDLLHVRGRFAPASEEWRRKSHRELEAGSIDAYAVGRIGSVGGIRGGLSRFRADVLGHVREVRGVGGDLLAGVLVGYRERVRGSPAETDFRAAGLSHLLAVSGTHLAVVIWLSSAVLGVLTRSRMFRAAGTVTTAVAYCVLTGMQVSTIRAAVMVTLAAVVSLLGRRGDALSALALAVAGIIALDPSQAFSIGLALSASAVAGLVVFGGLAGMWAQYARPRPRWLASALPTVLVAHISTAPLVGVVFGEFSSVGPIANLVAVPLVTFALWIGVVAALVSCVWAGGASMLFRLAAAILASTAACAEKMSGLPGAVVATPDHAVIGGVVALVVLLLLWVMWPVPGSRRQAQLVLGITVIVCLVPLIPVPQTGASELVVLDVGQGDAILVRDGGRALLVDTGEEPDVLRAALQRNGVSHLDAIVLTHLHADHTGGLEGVRGTASVGRVYVSAVALARVDEQLVLTAERVSGATIAAIEARDSLRLGAWELAVLWPGEGAPQGEDEENDRSVVLSARYGGSTALLTGDAEANVYAELDRSGLLPDVDVLKSPHHGSRDGVGSAQLERLSPAVAVVSVGSGNRFGHPAPSTISELAGSGARVFRTDQSGDISIVLKAGRVQVRTQNGSSSVPYERITADTTVRPAVGAHGLGACGSQTRIPHSRFGAVTAR